METRINGSKRHAVLGLLPLLEHLAHSGHCTKALLADQGLDLAHLQGSATLSQSQELHIVEQALALTQDPLLGLKVGSAVSLSSYGTFGMLLLSADSLADAVRASVEYQGLTYAFSQISLHVSRHHLELRFNHPPLDPKLQHFVVDRDLAGAMALNRQIDQHLAGAIQLGLARPQPTVDKLAEFHSYLGEAVTFNQPFSWLRYPKPLMSHPLPTANAIAHQLYKLQCQQQLAQLQPPQGALTEQITRLLSGYTGTFPSVSEVATTLGLSERTLRRRLNEVNTSYRQILDQHREQQARYLVTLPSQPVNQIAAQLGYADSVSFLSAFRRWTGTTPKRYLAQQHAKPPL